MPQLTKQLLMKMAGEIFHEQLLTLFINKNLMTTFLTINIVICSSFRQPQEAARKILDPVATNSCFTASNCSGTILGAVMKGIQRSKRIFDTFINIKIRTMANYC